MWFPKTRRQNRKSQPCVALIWRNCSAYFWYACVCCVCIYTSVNTHVYIYMCVYKNVYIYIYIHTYIHTYIPTHQHRHLQEAILLCISIPLKRLLLDCKMGCRSASSSNGARLRCTAGHVSACIRGDDFRRWWGQRT